MNKKELYESIMKNVAREVKKSLNVLNENSMVMNDANPVLYKFDGPVNTAFTGDSGVDYVVIYPTGYMVMFTADELNKQIDELLLLVDNYDETTDESVDFDIDNIIQELTILEELLSCQVGKWMELSGPVAHNNMDYPNKSVYTLGYRYK